MAKIVKYGTVEFPYSILEVNHTPIYDSDGRTLIGTSIVFAVTGVIVKETVSAFVTYLDTFKKELSKAAQDFTVKIGETFVYNIESKNDFSGGPKPGSLQLSEFMGGSAVSYRWSLDCNIKVCDQEGAMSFSTEDVILGYVMSYTDVVSESGMFSRSIAGKVHFGSKQADKHREYVLKNLIPKVPKGFRRVNMTFGYDESGHVMQFSVHDQEYFHNYPEGVVAASVDWSEAISINDHTLTMNLSGTFTGGPKTSKISLIQRAFELAKQRFPFRHDNFEIEKRELTESIYENTVGFAFQGVFYTFVVEEVASNKNNPLIIDGEYSLSLAAVTPVFGVAPRSYKNSVTDLPAWPQRGSLPYLNIEDYDACSGRLKLQEDKVSYVFPENFVVDPVTGVVLNPSTGSSKDKYSKLGTPYIDCHEVISYETDYGHEVFTSRQTGKTVVVQARAPVVTIIQAGYRVRRAQDLITKPAVPNPIMTNGEGGILLHRFVKPEAPIIRGNGWVETTVHWRYVIRVSDSSTYDLLVPEILGVDDVTDEQRKLEAYNEETVKD